MTMYLGDFPTGATVYVPFNTFDSNGASITLTGLAVTDIEIYKNGSATQRASDAGYTLLDTDGIDFDGITGIHGFSIDLSNDTDAGFFAAGNDYFVVVSSVTVDTRTVNFVAACFSIENRPPVKLADNKAYPTLGIAFKGTAQSATATTLVLPASAAFANATVIGMTVAAQGSTQAYWQARAVTGSVLSTDTLTVDTWTVTPSGTIETIVYMTAPASSSTPIPVNVTQFGGSAGTFASGRPEVKAFNFEAGAITSSAFAAGAIDAAAVATGAIDADAIAADAVTEIQSGLATAAALDTVDNFLDTEVAAILALLDDPRTEPGQGAPPVNPDLATKIDYLYKAWRNRSTVTATEYALYADNGTTKDQEAAISDNGTTFDRAEVTTGA